ncbi:hypothetical protein [Ensifer canadensis]
MERFASVAASLAVAPHLTIAVQQADRLVRLPAQRWLATFHTRLTISTADGLTEARSLGRGVGFELMPARELPQEGDELALILAAYTVTDAMLDDVEHGFGRLRVQLLIDYMFGHVRSSGLITPVGAGEFPA